MTRFIAGWLLLPIVLLSAGEIPHMVSGQVSYEDAQIVNSGHFCAYISTRPQEILTDSSGGCGFQEGYYFVQCASFPTDWQISDTLVIEVWDTESGRAAGSVLLTSEANDPMDLTIADAQLAVESMLLDFESVALGDSITLTLVVFNEGGRPLTLDSLNLSGEDASRFRVWTESDLDIPSGGSLNLSITYFPLSVEQNEVYLVIQSTDSSHEAVKVRLRGQGSDSSQSGISQQPETNPDQFSLSLGFPNPFNPHTAYQYFLPAPSRVSIMILNSRGQRILLLKEAIEAAGSHQICWNGQDQNGRKVSSGIYYLRFSAGSYFTVRKMLLLQ